MRWEAGDMLFSRRVGDDSLEVYTISLCGKGQRGGGVSTASLRAAPPALALPGWHPALLHLSKDQGLQILHLHLALAKGSSLIPTQEWDDLF